MKLAMKRTLARWMLTSSLFLLAGKAQAIAQFPEEIRTHLGLGYVPPCSLCHATATGGGPMAKGFGIAMQQRGLSMADLTSVGRALDRLEADALDANQNGASDIQDLRDGIDPNQPGHVLLAGPTPEYGCRIARRTHEAQGAAIPLWFGIVFGLWLVRRRGRPALAQEPRPCRSIE
jgi:hypothetical protein